MMRGKKFFVPGDAAHPSEGELLHFLDGELSPGDSERVRRHLESCWQCRSRSGKLSGVIADFMAVREADLEPQAARLQATADSFANRLNRAAADAPPERNGFRDFFGRPLQAAAVALLASVFWAYLINAPAMSASQLILEAVRAERVRLTSVTLPVIHQRWKVIRKSQGGAVDELGVIELWADQSSHEVRRAGAQAAWNELQPILTANRLAAPPFTIESFDTWRRQAKLTSETVHETRLPDGSAALQLTSTVSGFENSLRIRAADRHVVEQSFKVNAREYRLTEQSMDVIARASLEPSLITPGPAAPPAVVPSPAGFSLPPQKVDPALQKTRVSYALHSVLACRGEQIDVAGEGGMVTVRGVVETAERRKQIQAALGGLTGVRMEIRSADDPSPTPTRARNLAPPQMAPAIPADPPVMHQLLVEHFRRSEGSEAATDRAARFETDVVTAVEACMMEAWALRRHAGWASNAPPDRVLLDLMLRDHEAALRSELEKLRQILRPVACSLISCGLSVPAGSPADRFAVVEKIDRLAKNLFASAQSSGFYWSPALRELMLSIDEASAKTGK